MNNQKLLVVFTVVIVVILAILFKGIPLWMLPILGMIIILLYIHRGSGDKRTLITKQKQTNNVTDLPMNGFTNKCVNCGKQYNAKAIKKTWSVNGQVFFCSWECDLEWSRKRSSRFIQSPPSEDVEDENKTS